MDRYEGFMKDGKLHGRGVYEWGVGDLAEEMVPSPAGFIRVAHPPDLIVDGQWRDGKPHGYAERRYPRKGIAVFGRHYDGKVTGCGVHRDKDGMRALIDIDHDDHRGLSHHGLDYVGSGRCGSQVLEYYYERVTKEAINRRLFANAGTMLHAVAEHGDFDSLDTLLRLGFDPNAATDRGEMPLHLVAGRNYDEVKLAALLIAKGAILDVETNAGYTPLRKAVINRNIQIARLLLKSGAAVNLGEKIPKSWGGGYKFPLDDARDTENKELISLIEAYGGRSGREENIAPDIAKLVVLAAAVVAATAIVHEAQRATESKAGGSTGRSSSSGESASAKSRSVGPPSSSTGMPSFRCSFMCGNKGCNDPLGMERSPNMYDRYTREIAAKDAYAAELEVARQVRSEKFCKKVGYCDHVSLRCEIVP